MGLVLSTYIQRINLPPPSRHAHRSTFYFSSDPTGLYLYEQEFYKQEITITATSTDFLSLATSLTQILVSTTEPTSERLPPSHSNEVQLTTRYGVDAPTTSTGKSNARRRQRTYLTKTKPNAQTPQYSRNIPSSRTRSGRHHQKIKRSERLPTGYRSRPDVPFFLSFSFRDGSGSGSRGGRGGGETG